MTLKTLRCAMKYKLRQTKELYNDRQAKNDIRERCNHAENDFNYYKFWMEE